MPLASPDTSAMLADTPLPGQAPEGLTAQFGAVYRDLVRFFARRTGNEDDARDLAQDTWLRLAEHERSQGHVAPLHTRAYLFTVAQHIAIDHLRRRRLGNALREVDTHAAPDVADAVMYGQAVRVVEAALQQLPERARDVFLQHRLLGVGQAELAERYQLSRNMIERDVMLAMDRVQAAIEQWHDGEAGPARKGRRRSLATLLGLAGLLGTGSAVWQAWRHAVPQWQLALSSRRGQILRQLLPDGSELTLDARSRIDVRFFATQRCVVLHAGAAFFSVARDADRPFVVDAGAARITVLGTRFGVELGGDATEVLVESGQVRVQARHARGQLGEPVMLREGQAVRVVAPADRGDGRIETLTAAPAVASPWRTGMLIFEATPLRDAVQRLDRYGEASVTLDERVAALPVSGQLRIAQALDWLQALPAVLPVRVERHARSTDGNATEGWQIRPR